MNMKQTQNIYCMTLTSWSWNKMASFKEYYKLTKPKVVMLIIFAIYIVGGAVMDALALLLITIPIFFPVAMQLGYDPIWFGVTITVVTTMGAVTPPVGATTYVVGGMARDVRLEEVFKGVAYFLPAYIICVIILMIFPKLITFLPSLIR